MFAAVAVDMALEFLIGAIFEHNVLLLLVC